MALTESTMLPLGTQAPDFTLPDYNGKPWSLGDFKSGRGLLVVFMCNHCPYVIHIRHALAALAKEYAEKGIETVGINANDITSHPDDAPEHMAQMAKDTGLEFPYLFDATQNVAKAYKAACTPDFFLFDPHRKLVYRGRFDDSTPGNNKPVTGHDLRVAINAMLEGKPVPEPQLPSMGCNIKWQPGNEPEYFG